MANAESKGGGTRLEENPPQELLEAKGQYDKALEEIFKRSLEKGDELAKGLQARGEVGWNKDGIFNWDLSAAARAGWYSTVRDEVLAKIGEKSRAAGELIAGVGEMKTGASIVEMPDGNSRLVRKEDGSIAFEGLKGFYRHFIPGSNFEESPGRKTWEMLWQDVREKREVELRQDRPDRPTEIQHFAAGNDPAIGPREHGSRAQPEADRTAREIGLGS